MNYLYRIILIGILVTLAISKSSSQKKAAVIDVTKIELTLNQTVPVSIKNLDPSKAFMINVEYSETQQKFNEFQVRLNNQNSKNYDCHFKYINNLCVIDKPTKEIKGQLTCLQPKCTMNIVFSQRRLVSVNDNTDFKRKFAVPGEIYQLGLRKSNTILQVYSQREEHEILSSEIVIFSNIHAFPLQQTEELDTNGAIFGLKPIKNEADQYIYIENRSEKKQSLKMQLKTHNGQLRDGISIVDFIENFGRHSHNNYTFVGSFQNNIQAKVRVFSPRDPKGIPVTFAVHGRTSQQEEDKIIRQIKFDPVQFNEQNFFDFTFGITKAVHQTFKFISFQILLHEVEDKSIFFQIGVHDADSLEINIFQHVYFGSLAGQRLHFTVQPQVKLQLASGDKEIQILTNANEKYFSNIQSCSLHKGCSIEIKTENQCKTCSFLFNLKDEDTKNHIIYYQVKEDTIEGKVDMQQMIYFKYSMNGKSATQVIVNSMNVMIYANFLNYQRCKVPSRACHEYTINQQNPMVVHNRQDQPTELVLGVLGLGKASFKVRFINEMNGMQIKLGERFSYLMDNEEKDLDLKFVINPQSLGQEHHHLHFNLVSPIHSLKLTVANLDGQTVESLQGYISFDKQNIRGDLFSIKIEKVNQYYDEYVHFTLVVTTSDMALRLDSTITHYEKYMKKQEKTFLIQYDSSEVNALNIYTENLQKEKTTMLLRIRKSNSEDGDTTPKNVISHKLIRDYEFIDLDADLQAIDICDDTNCELQITIKNEGQGELEQSLTLMAEESIISLDDSIWSIFQINELSRSNHFYFIPRNKNKPITILFNTDDNLLYVNYRIFNTNLSINPQDWPFGHAPNTQGRFSSSQEIFIPGDDAQLAACWPTCVILVNINQAQKNDEKRSLDHSIIKSYKIIATNNILELLQDTKLEITLKNQDEKVLFILAKNVLKYEKLSFFTYYSFGRAKITVSVVSNQKQYKLKGDKDFIFQDLQTQFPTHLIAAIVNSELLNIDTILLKITIEALTNLKMTFEYSSMLKDMYRLNMDELQVMTLRKGEQMWYEFLPERDFTLKLYRMKGFPLFKIFKCNDEKYTECLNHHKLLFEAGTLEFLQTEGTVKENLAKQNKEIQLNELQGNKTYPFEVFVEKSYELIDQQCQNCIYFLWVYCFEGDLQLTINVRTSVSQVELKEMNVLNQRADFGQHNKYLVNILHNKDTIITITILEGAAQVVISDSTTTLFDQQLNSIDSSYKDFTINADEDDEVEQQQEEEAKEVMDVNDFGKLRKSNEKHVFRHVHVTVSTTSQGPVEYLISYSVGSSSLYLQDGIVIQKNMIPDIPHTFFYRNHNKKEYAYLTLSSQVQTDYEFINAKNALSVKFYYYPDASDRTIKQTFEPQLPPQRNENYLGSTITHVYQLSSKFQLYQIEILTGSYLKVTASINHQELVYLPLGFEYLIKLHANQNLNLVIDNPQTEYMQVRIKKCDESVPTLQYTNDAHEFKKGVFEAEIDIDNSNFRQYIKTKKSSKTVHLRLMGGSDEDSLLSVSVGSSSRELKQKANAYKAGDKGLIDYKMIQTDTIEVTFKAATCDRQCNSTFLYYLVVSESMQQIYGQLNCAGSYFVPQASKILPKSKTDLIIVGEKRFDKTKGQYKQRVKLTGKQVYIGVKAVVDNGKDEILYVPVQIRSFWGEISKVSFGIVVMGSLAAALILTVVIVVSTKLARRGYKPISSDE